MALPPSRLERALRDAAVDLGEASCQRQSCSRRRWATRPSGHHSPSRPGQLEWEAAQSHHRLPWWICSIFSSMKVTSAFLRHSKVSAGRLRFSPSATICDPGQSLL